MRGLSKHCFVWLGAKMDKGERMSAWEARPLRYTLYTLYSGCVVSYKHYKQTTNITIWLLN